MVEIVSSDGILYEILAKTPNIKLHTLVHVGAHLGQEIRWYEQLKPQRVIWIEGDPEIIPRLRENLATYSTGTVEHVVVEALITDQDGDEVNLRRFNNMGMSSSLYGETALMKELYEGLGETGDVHRARSYTLASVLRGVGVKPEELDALIVDIQGAELLCLKGAGEYLAAAKFLEVEVSNIPLYDGAPLFPELNALISAHGLRLISPVPEHGDVVYANTRFVKFDAPQQVGPRPDGIWDSLSHDRLYFILLHSGRPPLHTVVHVGAHIGQELPLYEELGAQRIVWIEGDPATLPLLQANIVGNSKGGVEHLVVQALVGDKDGVPAKLHRFNQDGQATSLFPASAKMGELFNNVMATGETVDMPMTRLPTLLRAVGVAPEEVTALILDVQGAELLCLHGLGEELRAISYIEIEVSIDPVYEGAPRFEEVHAWMTSHGFRLITTVPLHGDVVYLNNRLAGMPHPSE